MQSALVSLRQGTLTKRVFIDQECVQYGIGSDHLILTGHYKFRILKGAVQICGITLTSSNGGDSFKYYTVSAPVAPFPVIEACRQLQSFDSNGPDIPVELQDFLAVIEVKTTEIVPNISKLAPPFRQLWHNTYQYFPDSAGQSFEYIIAKSWTEIPMNLPAFVILGPKNSGKSNLARYLSNKLLVAGKSRVFYLELDPGQPEYTVPGCLSLHRLSDLNFSPGYFHPSFDTVIKCHYLGYVSPNETPSRYLNMCQSLISAFHAIKQFGDALVVNTPGWTKGLGLELNTEIVNMVEAAEARDISIIHLGDTSDFNLENMKIVDGFNDDEVNSAATRSFSAAELRSLQLMIYFHQSDISHLTSWAPFEVDFDRVRIAVLDSEGVDLKTDLSICIEGMVVAIGVPSENNSDKVASDTVDPIMTDAVWQFTDIKGMAIVQLVKSRSLCLLVPCSLQSLGIKQTSLTILIRGRVQLPIWELYDKALGSSPWVSTNKSPGIGGSYIKFRRNIQR